MLSSVKPFDGMDGTLINIKSMTKHEDMPRHRVAVIGAGPGGLVAARYLLSEGLEPVLFEQGKCIGGQWSGEPQQSGVWPSMRTNTSRIMTAFSDLPHEPGTPTYPSNQRMAEYLERYAEKFDLTRRVRLNTSVSEVRRDADGGWIVKTAADEERFEQVVVASGRYNKPILPDVPGLQSFTGSGGVNHAFAYKHPEQFLGLRVLVAGCSISSLEIASDLATSGAARVVVTNRRQRYVLPKLIAGVPTDHLAFTRFAALAGECFPMEAMGAAMKEFVLGASGSPEQFGAIKPAENIFEAGLTQSQFFLPLVAEGRIAVKPWIESVDGQTVHFSDGTSEVFDAVLFGTGYALDLPFLSIEIRAALNADAQHLDLFNFTFSPELPGLAFLGLLEVVGPYYPVLELQARWIAYTMSGSQPTPSVAEMDAGIAAYRARRGGPQALPNHVAAILFSRAAGVEPELARWPELTRAFLFGPLSAVSFRMSGHDSLADAAERYADEIQAFGCMPSHELSPMQSAQLHALADARGDEAFRRHIAAVAPA
jgi:dimethylaniline monooxygenase (N-oxide forming)